MENIPNWIHALFLIIVVGVVILFYFANNQSSSLVTWVIIWGGFQSILALSGFYLITDTLPPRLLFILLPAAFFVAYHLHPKTSLTVYQSRNFTCSLLLHSSRIGVEATLYYLFCYGMVPELMTFSGRNFDILAGLSALLILGLLIKGKISNRGLLYWNYAGLGLVMFILINGILSAKSPLQQFGFEQPNIAVFFFPYILLPAVIVPIVVYTHIRDILYLNHLINKQK